MKALRFLFLAAIAILAVTVSGCRSSKEATEAEKLSHRMAAELIDAKSFMLKADRLSINNTIVPLVSSSTTFITVSDNKATVQVSPASSGGPNGVGGFTVNGTITSYKVKTRDNGEINVEFHVSSTAGSCDVVLNVSRYSNSTTAFVNSTFRSGRVTINGLIEPTDNTIYRGYSKYGAN